jgi:hypothetical protein
MLGRAGKLRFGAYDGEVAQTPACNYATMTISIYPCRYLSCLQTVLICASSLSRVCTGQVGEAACLDFSENRKSTDIIAHSHEVSVSFRNVTLASYVHRRTPNSTTPTSTTPNYTTPTTCQCCNIYIDTPSDQPLQHVFQIVNFLAVLSRTSPIPNVTCKKSSIAVHPLFYPSHLIKTLNLPSAKTTPRATMTTPSSTEHIQLLSHGEVVEEGTHAQLLAQNGSYARRYIANLLSTPAPARQVPLQVLALGLPRTGTASVKAALDILGYRTHSAFDVLEFPKTSNEWERLACVKWGLEGREGARGGFVEKGDFERLLGHYSAVADVPSAMFWEELVEFYPEVCAKSFSFCALTICCER